jgi:hypothetical protein
VVEAAAEAVVVEVHLIQMLGILIKRILAPYMEIMVLQA